MNLNLFKIYFGVALSLLAAASAWGWSPMFKINEDDSFLIDDFEDGDYASFLGPWNITTEEKFNTELKYSIVDSKDLESKVLKIEYTFPAKDLQLNDHYEWIDAQIYVANYTSLDFSKCTEMQFDYKATYSDGDVDPSECDYYEDCRLDLRFRALGDEKKADVGILTVQQGEKLPDNLKENSDYIIQDIKEVLNILDF